MLESSTDTPPLETTSHGIVETDWVSLGHAVTRLLEALGTLDTTEDDLPLSHLEQLEQVDWIGVFQQRPTTLRRR